MTNAENRYYLAIDVGGMSVKFGLYSVPSGSGIPQLTAKSTIPTRTENSGCRILPDIADAIQRQASEAGISLSDIAGIGIGVPGPVILNEDGRSVVNGCVNLGWGRKNVSRELSGLLDGVPVYVGNDANVAALGEAWRGAAKGHRDVVMVTLGTGVGGGVVVGGGTEEQTAGGDNGDGNPHRQLLLTVDGGKGRQLALGRGASLNTPEGALQNGKRGRRVDVTGQDDAHVAAYIIALEKGIHLRHAGIL